MARLKWTRPRFCLLTLMVVIGVVAVGLWYPIRLRNGVRDAWNGPISTKVSKRERFGDFTGRLHEESSSWRRPKGLPFIFDHATFRRQEVTGDTPIGSDFEARGEPMHAFLNRVLKPMGLIAKIDIDYPPERGIFIESIQAANIPTAP